MFNNTSSRQQNRMNTNKSSVDPLAALVGFTSKKQITNTKSANTFDQTDDDPWGSSNQNQNNNFPSSEKDDEDNFGEWANFDTSEAKDNNSKVKDT